MKDRFPSETQDRVMVRLPDGMHRDIKDAGKAANRNMTQEIVARLKWTFKNDEAFRADVTLPLVGAAEASELESLRALVRALENRIGEAEKRLGVAEDALVPDFTLGQRIEAVEAEVEALKARKR